MMAVKNRNILQKMKELEETLMSKLTIDIIAEIVSRLPIKTIIQCRCVCKSWRELISAPYFIDLHFSNSRATCSLLLVTGRSYFSSTPSPPEIYLCDIGANQYASCDSAVVDGNRYATVSLLGPKFINFPCSTDQVAVVGSCNGFLCLVDRGINKNFYICNPVLGEYMEIPQPEQKGFLLFCYYDWSGFCYDSESNQYKVLFSTIQKQHLFDSWKFNSHILTIGSDHVWRNIGPLPSQFKKYGKGSTQPIIDITLNGALHWVSYIDDDDDDDNDSIVITCFGIKNEHVKSIALPQQVNKEMLKVCLGVLNSLLCLCIDYDWRPSKFDIWVMKEYGIEKSWTKLCVVNSPSISIVAVTRIKNEEDGENLLLSDSRTIVSYNPRSKESRKVEIDKNLSESGFDIVTHTPSFVSIKTISSSTIKRTSRLLNVESERSRSAEKSFNSRRRTSLEHKKQRN